MFAFGITIFELMTDVALPKDGDIWHDLRTGFRLASSVPSRLQGETSQRLWSLVELLMHREPARSACPCAQLARPDAIAHVS
jgi:hypothetical protein